MLCDEMEEVFFFCIFFFCKKNEGKIANKVDKPASKQAGRQIKKKYIKRDGKLS